MADNSVFQSTPPVKAATTQNHLSRLGVLGFQSTPPVKAATEPNGDPADDVQISIHAAREGGDFKEAILTASTFISIHAAREGGDLAFLYVLIIRREFQSTPPVKAATYNLRQCAYQCQFQSTPPVKAATVNLKTKIEAALFQSTPPVKAATAETNRRNQHFRKQQV